VLHRRAAALPREPAPALHEGDHRRVEALVQRDRVADVVVVAVRDEDQVDPLRLLLGLRALRVPVQERVDVHALPARRVEAEGGVAEPGERDAGHAFLLWSGRSPENLEERSGPTRIQGAMPARVLPVLLVLGSLGADAVGAHELAFVLLVASVPAAAVSA